MRARLYTIELAHPGHAARLMLEHKGIDHRVTVLPAGLHPALLRLMGFRAGTVPAARVDGRRVETSIGIARELERIVPEPPLYPREQLEREKVERAERWSDAELQPIPRRIMRWALTEQVEARRWLATIAKLPLPALQARINLPLVRHFAKISGATPERVRSDLAELPRTLDRVDELIGDGTIGADSPNAATFQVGASVRALALFEQLEPLVEGRPCGDLARALLPEFPRSPVELPEAWLSRPKG